LIAKDDLVGEEFSFYNPSHVNSLIQLMEENARPFYEHFLRTQIVKTHSDFICETIEKDKDAPSEMKERLMSKIALKMYDSSEELLEHK